MKGGDRHSTGEWICLSVSGVHLTVGDVGGGVSQTIGSHLVFLNVLTFCLIPFDRWGWGISQGLHACRRQAKQQLLRVAVSPSHLSCMACRRQAKQQLLRVAVSPSHLACMHELHPLYYFDCCLPSGECEIVAFSRAFIALKVASPQKSKP